MDITINTDEGEKTIVCKNPKGRHTKKALKMLIDAQKGGDEQVERFQAYLDYLDEMTCEGTGLKMEELDELDSDEKNKLVEFYSNKVDSRLDFLKSSLKQGSSVERTTQVT